MSGEKLEILWSPVHQDKFITWGADISLYEVAPLVDIEKKPSCIKLSDSTGAYLVASNGNYQYVKCIDIYPQEDSDMLLALGHANGKVVLTTFGHTCYDNIGINGRELVPRHGRQCNSLAWNKCETNILAVGLDKYKNDHGILLWDIMKSTSANDGSASPRIQGGSSQYAVNAVELAKPVAELALSDMVHSLSWGNHPRTLVAGVNHKQLKFYDLRDPGKERVTSTKYVYSVCVDPLNEYQLASTHECICCVWDMRYMDRTLVTIVQPRPITSVLWCPTRRNLLCSLHKDSCTLKLHDIQPSQTQVESQGTPTGETETSLCALERSVCPPAPHTITSFSWHPTHRARLIAISLSGSILDYGVYERVTLAWGSGQLLWTKGHTSLHLIPNDNALMTDDIAHLMRKRARFKYGLEGDLAANGELADDESLKSLWSWLALSKSLVDEGCIRGCPWKHPGVRWTLRLEPGAPTYRSEAVPTILTDFGNLNTTTYRSTERGRALQLCGWEDSNACGTSPRRNAARLIWSGGHVRAALEQLRSVEPSLALALAGYCEERAACRELAKAVRSSHGHVYVRALLAFLTDADVLSENEMRLVDRVGYACTYLADNKLSDYIRTTTQKVIDDGELSGLILTGMGPDGVTLIQNWLDKTGDVQSAALLAARCFTHELLKDKRVQNWIQSYRQLLECWREYTARCGIDSALYAAHSSLQQPQQVYISCNFCGKTISAPQGLNRTRTTFSRIMASSNKTKISACPNCRKPLPRCAVCLLHLGTAAAGIAVSSSGSGASNTTGGGGGGGGGVKTAQLGAWLTWCQTCRHGGHAAHLTQWFMEHNECPVASCPCKCLSLDLPSTLR